MKLNLRNRKVLPHLNNRPPTRQDGSQSNFDSRERDANQKQKRMTPYDKYIAPYDERYSNSQQLRLPSILQLLERMQQMQSIPRFPTDPRDRNIIVPFPTNRSSYFSLKHEYQKLQAWLGQMHFAVASSSFDLLTNKSLTYEQTKVYCCQNFLYNILMFYQLVPTQDLFQVTRSMDQILNRNLEYLLLKYPQTKQANPNKKLKQVVEQVNNMESDQHDMLKLSNINFTYKETQDYTREIMTFINYIIIKQNQLVSQTVNKSYFQLFYDTMEGVFTSVYHPYREVQPIKASKGMLSMVGIKQPQSQQEKKREKQQKDYTQKVKSYTSYKVDQKIKPDTPLFTKDQIETGQFSVKSTSVLRILAKWIEQLQRKIRNAQQLLLRRLYRFKNRKIGLIKLVAGQKNELYQQAKKQMPKMNQFLQQIQQSCFEIEGILAANSSILQKNIPRQELMVGNFCQKIESAASSYLFSYLNKVIHCLLEIPHNIIQKFNDNEFMIEEMNIDLITFKVGDMFRCKCTSHEYQIIRIYNLLREMSDDGKILKIIRIKDRLQTGTRDILINCMFKNIFICEIQLAVVDEVNQKQNLYDKFNHFLYELKRADLGSIMESGCIWVHLDQRALAFKKNFKDSDRCIRIGGKRKQHLCIPNFKDYDLAFVCTLCGQFYSNQFGLFKNRKCNECKKFYQCRNCFENRMDEKKLKQFLGLNDMLQMFSNQFVMWNLNEDSKQLPKFGVLISRKMKQIQPMFFNIIKLKKYDQVIVFKGTKVEVLASIRNEQSDRLKFSKDYLVFEWVEKRKVNRTYFLNHQDEEDDIKRRKRPYPGFRPQKRMIKADEAKQNLIFTLVEKQLFKGQQVEVRVAFEQNSGITNILILEPYKKDSELKGMIRQKFNLKQIQRMLRNKMQVISFEDESITKQFLLIDQKKKFQSSLSSIRQLYLDDNSIYDLKFISSMPNLKVIHMNYNTIYDMQPLQALFNLIELKLQRNSIQFVNGLTNCKQLNVLSLSSNNIEVIEGFQELKNLEILSLYNNDIYSIKGLDNLQNLAQLDLSNNNIGQIQNFDKVLKLCELDLSGNLLQKIQGLEPLLNLTHLDLSGNRIKEISGLENKPKLIHLQLTSNLISKIQNLHVLPKIQKLILNRNYIRKIQNLNNLLTLKVLDISQNEILNIENIGHLKALRKLDLSSNWIRKINHRQVSKLKKLQHFQIGDNFLQIDKRKNSREQKAINDENGQNGEEESILRRRRVKLQRRQSIQSNQAIEQIRNRSQSHEYVPVYQQRLGQKLNEYANMQSVRKPSDELLPEPSNYIASYIASDQQIEKAPSIEYI